MDRSSGWENSHSMAISTLLWPTCREHLPCQAVPGALWAFEDQGGGRRGRPCGPKILILIALTVIFTLVEIREPQVSAIKA